MRDRMRFAIAASALALGAGASTMAAQTSDKAAIRAVATEYMAAFNAHDPDRLVKVHTPDAVVMVSNTPLATGSVGIRSSFAEFFKTSGANLSFTPTKVDVVSKTVATEYGTYVLTFDTPQGKMTDKGNYTTIWRKINGKWLIAVDAPVTTTPMPMPAAPAAAMSSPEVHIIANSALNWGDFNPPGFDPGMKLAVISGDPGKAGEYTVRLMFPAGYRFPVHWHPGIENLTVVSGTFQLAMGNTADWSALKNYGPGDYMYMPPRHAHYGGSAPQGPSVIQLHGIGPFDIKLGPGM